MANIMPAGMYPEGTTLNGLNFRCQRSAQASAGTLWYCARIVILLGAPGVGKGTQAQRIAEQYGLQHVSTGDVLRDNVHGGTELGRKAKPIIDRGELVPDDIVLAMVQARVAQADCKSGLILDGFPRTLRQAKGLEGIDRLYKSRSTTVLNIVAQPELLIRRMTNRRICKMSGHIYNLVNRPPMRPNICDADGSELMQRPDDTDAVIRERIRTYECHARPLIDYYSAQGLLHEVQGAADPDAVRANIMKVLDREGPTK
jgi:adenylate kinase